MSTPKNKIHKRERSAPAKADRDTMRPEYDFSDGVRGVTAARCAEGSNIIVVDPEVLDVFPNAASVNEAPRVLAPVLRARRPIPLPRAAGVTPGALNHAAAGRSGR